jgi:hypothetical protein
MAETAVYQFTWWDRHASKEVISSRFATLEAISRCDGKIVAYWLRRGIVRCRFHFREHGFSVTDDFPNPCFNEAQQ